MRRLIRGTRAGGWPAALLLLVLLIAVGGRLVAPYSLSEVAGLPAMPPSRQHLLGTDELGRDVLSRVLYGGTGVLLIAVASTALAYLMGTVLGMSAAVSKSYWDVAVARSMDVILSIPAILFLLVMLAGLGRGLVVLTIGTALIRLPLLTRVARTATREALTFSYVEAAVARGESTYSVLAREVFPNIANTIFAKLGLSFTYAVVMIASLNYLGVGMQPPSPDWGIMISDNRDIMMLNPWSVLVPTGLLALLTITITLTWDRLSGREATAPAMDVVSEAKK